MRWIEWNELADFLCIESPTDKQKQMLIRAVELAKEEIIAELGCNPVKKRGETILMRDGKGKTIYEIDTSRGVKIYLNGEEYNNFSILNDEIIILDIPLNGSVIVEYSVKDVWGFRKLHLERSADIYLKSFVGEARFGLKGRSNEAGSEEYK